jgi:CheY-like chemotaxis protein
MRGASALIIEDNQQWLGIFRDELLAAGFRIDFAFGRHEAMRKLVDPPFRYDLVVLDPNLGDSLGGRSGVAIAERVAESDLTSVVVVVSGFAQLEQMKKDYADLTPPVVAFFEKAEFELDTFRAILQQRRGPEDPNQAMFTPDREQAAAAWREAAEADDADAKGKSLERLAVELLSGIPLLTHHESRARTPTAEFDAVFVVEAKAGTLCQEWGRLLVVECRNRTEKFDASSVRTFAQKMDAVDAKIGIVFSVAGITGDERRAASGTVDDVFARDRRVIIVLDRGDITKVVREDANLYTLLQAKDMDVRLRRS